MSGDTDNASTIITGMKNDMNWGLPSHSSCNNSAACNHGAGDHSHLDGHHPKRVPKPRNVFSMGHNALQQAAAAYDEYQSSGRNLDFQNLLAINDPPQQELQEQEHTDDEEEGEEASDESEASGSTCKFQESQNDSVHNDSSDECVFNPNNSTSSNKSLTRFSSTMSNSSGSSCSHSYRSNILSPRSDDLESREIAERERLTEENMVLVDDLRKSRRRGLSLKVVATMAMAAFRTQRILVAEVKKARDSKTMEAAARMILHNLLLNSWRNCKVELKSLSEENVQLNKTLDNLSLQLRVVRHIQTLEKEKLTEKGAELERMKSEMKRLKDENDSKRNSMDKIESEFNSMQGKVQNLDDLNKLYVSDALVLKETIKALEQSLDTERIKSGTIERSNNICKQDKKRAEEQLGDVTRQNQHWQERARAFESEAWALKMDLDGKDAQIKEVRTLCDSLRKEKTEILRSKTEQKAKLREVSDKLEHAENDRANLVKEIVQIKAKLDEEAEHANELKESLEMSKNLHSVAEKELLSLKVQGCKRRREWANALYFLFNPLDAFRRSLVPPPDQNKLR